MAKRRNDKYQHKQNAVCVTMYDMAGNAVPEDVVQKVLDYASKMIKDSPTLAINLTRT